MRFLTVGNRDCNKHRVSQGVGGGGGRGGLAIHGSMSMVGCHRADVHAADDMDGTGRGQRRGVAQGDQPPIEGTSRTGRLQRRSCRSCRIQFGQEKSNQCLISDPASQMETASKSDTYCILNRSKPPQQHCFPNRSLLACFGRAPNVGLCVSYQAPRPFFNTEHGGEKAILGFGMCFL